jgi:hypothetical protein
MHIANDRCKLDQTASDATSGCGLVDKPALAALFPLSQATAFRVADELPRERVLSPDRTNTIFWLCVLSCVNLGLKYSLSHWSPEHLSRAATRRSTRFGSRTTSAGKSSLYIRNTVHYKCCIFSSYFKGTLLNYLFSVSPQRS